MSVQPLSNINALQATATNPQSSIWVSANAGSGKTYVLSRRVIRLLLEGNKPSQLLCLTFTKAAAAEMSNRVFKILSEWSMMNDSALQDAIEELLGKTLSPDTKNRFISRARILFALALDTPGGLRIQTIHAFCESLLHQFPLEANVPGHFEMIDELEQSQLLEDARRHVLLTGLGVQQRTTTLKDQETEKQIRDAFSTIREHASDAAIEKAISQLVQEREFFTQWLDDSGADVYIAMAPLWRKFGLSPQSSARKLREEIASSSAYSKEAQADLIDLFRSKGGARSDALLEQFSALAEASSPNEKIEIRKSIFFTSGNPKKGFISAKFMEDNGLWDTYLNEQQLLLEQFDRLNTLESLKASEALFIIAEAMLVGYENLKRRKGLLDFNDLIARTANLLSRNEISAWIHYKLDSGISHLLVDEAQDTSPMQWKIIEAITAEFYAGKGARELIRTIFVVGDEKQSIYSFQGADPREFARQFSILKEKSGNAQLYFDEVKLTTSFRSTPEVLSAVDQVFSLTENAAGLGLDGNQQVHQANRRSDRGEVFVWPLEIKQKKPEKIHWRKPPDEPTPEDAEVRLADKITETIHGWIQNQKRLHGQERPIRYGDILILVRKRDRFVATINRALKAKGLAAAGADRLKLTEHIAVEDMLALGRFACMKMDDLSLAALLKSPIFDFSEEELFAVSHKRSEATLLAQLSALSEAKLAPVQGQPSADKLRRTLLVLNDVLSSAHSLPVFAFYARLFSRHHLRQKYLTRLGHEAAEILDGFFQAAMNFDNQKGLGLQSFVESLAASKLELKREIDMERDEIRVITTHSSKGLEAPIVFLVDPGSKAFNTSHAPPIVQLGNEENGFSYLWQSEKKKRIAATTPVFEQLERQAEEEYRRLLYVGMTRAADRLIICGYRGEREPDYDHWYSMVEKGLLAPKIDQQYQGKFVDADGGDDPTKIRQWIINNRDHKEKHLKKSDDLISEHVSTLPSWCAPLPIEPPAPRPLSPSGVLELLNIAPKAETTFNGDSAFALDRGNALHHLMQILPDMDLANRDGVISKYFETTNGVFTPSQVDDIRLKLNKILNASEAAELFTPNSKAEVEISGEVTLGKRTHMVRGKIDRLAITPDRIVIADYKTNRQVPNTPDEVSTEYLAQMALYQELVKKIYPDRKIECLIIWSENGRFMPVPSALLDRQMALLNKS